MAQAMMWRTGLAGGVAALLIACAGSGTVSSDQQRSSLVRQELEAFGQSLRTGNWSRVERFFSPANAAGVGELRDRMEERSRAERIVELQFIVGRVLESDRLVNAQVRWNKSWVTPSGQPGRSSGTSEFVLEPHGPGYRILRITGDRLF
jgi:hypothetical protein